MTRGIAVLSVLAVTYTAPASGFAQALSLQLRDGRVTLDARDVSVRRILDEWARLGQVSIVNPDALPAIPTTLVLTEVSERVALDVLLRDTAGYILGPRQSPSGSTEIDRIFIVPRGGVTPSPMVSSGAANRPQPVPPPDGAPAAESATFLIIGGAAGLVRQSDDFVSAGGQVSFSTGGDSSTAGSPPPNGDAAVAARPAELPPRPTPIRYLDTFDENGNRMRAPTVPPEAETVLPPGTQAAPPNPFNVTTGSATPGTASPARRP